MNQDEILRSPKILSQMEKESTPLLKSLYRGLIFGGACGLVAAAADLLGRMVLSMSAFPISSLATANFPLSNYNLPFFGLAIGLSGVAMVPFILGGGVLNVIWQNGIKKKLPQLGFWVVVGILVLPGTLLLLRTSLLGTTLSLKEAVAGIILSIGVAALVNRWLRSGRLLFLFICLPVLMMTFTYAVGWLHHQSQFREAMSDPSLANSNASPTADAPDVLLLTLDTLRADHLGCYGHEPARTPNLDRLAAEGVLYERAYAPSSSTQPSHASILTGYHMPWHGMRINGEAVLDSSLPTITEMLAAKGYHTAAVLSAFPLDRKFGFWRGFNHYDDQMPITFGMAKTEPLVTAKVLRHCFGMRMTRRLGIDGFFSEGLVNTRNAIQTTEAAISALEDSPEDRPLFMWVHYWDPHAPYSPPPEYHVAYPLEDNPREGGYPFWFGDYATKAEIEADYDGEIAFMDDYIGRLLEAFEKHRERPFVVVATSDHGEGLYEHDVVTHGPDVFDVTLHVPLILSGAGIPKGVRIAESVSSYDIAPTVLDVCKAGKLAEDVHARTLLPFDNTAPATATDRTLYHESTWKKAKDGQPRQFNYAWRVGGWKFLDLSGREGPEQGPVRLFYHVEEDPQEFEDRMSSEEERAMNYLRTMGEFIETFPVGRGQAITDTETQQQMAEIGYGGGDDE